MEKTGESYNIECDHYSHKTPYGGKIKKQTSNLALTLPH
jgi:hypothetical protein